MKKASLFIPFFFLLLPLHSFSQKDSNKTKVLKDSAKIKPFASIAINIGAGLPSGISLGHSSLNSYAWYAKPGPCINLYGIIPIHHSWLGVAGLIGYQSNLYDTTGYSETGTYSTSILGSFNIYTAMAGLCASIFGKNADIEFRFLAGEIYFKAPEIVYSGALLNPLNLNGPGPAPGTWEIMASSTSAFAYDIGASVKLPLGKKFLWIFNGDFLHSGLNGGLYQITQFTPFNGGPGSQSGFEYGYMSSFSLTMGIGYKL